MKKTLAFVAGCVLSAASVAANAAIINVTWTGQVTDVGAAGSVVSLGDTITGAYSFDSTARGNINAPAFADYATLHVSTFSINGLSGSTTNNRIFVLNDRASVGDQFDSRSGGGGAYSGDLIAGRSVSQIFARFNDSTATAFDTLDLPTNLSSTDFDFTAESRLDGPNIRFDITDFTMSVASPAAVPEAATAALLLAGLVPVHFGARRRLRS